MDAFAHAPNPYAGEDDARRRTVLGIGRIDKTEGILNKRLHITQGRAVGWLRAQCLTISKLLLIYLDYNSINLLVSIDSIKYWLSELE